jgi:hypothetical protein
LWHNHVLAEISLIQPSSQHEDDILDELATAITQANQCFEHAIRSGNIILIFSIGIGLIPATLHGSLEVFDSEEKECPHWWKDT